MKRISPPLQSLQNESLKKYSTFGIGGPAAYVVGVATLDELRTILVFCSGENIPYLVVGKGSNTLFSDQGFDGIVILNKIVYYERTDLLVSVGGGYSFSLLGMRTARENLSGLEFAAGIPATVGGAIYMNAGIGKDQTGNALEEVTYVNEKGEIEVFQKEALQFSYRTSSFQQMRGVIAGAKFQLTQSVDAKQRVQELVDHRLLTQPYKARSAGCIFRNPSEGPSAGALIDQCGLKGVRRGGAEVSSLHANFIINRGEATAEDVLRLIKHIQGEVKAQTGIELEKELCESLPC